MTPRGLLLLWAGLLAALPRARAQEPTRPLPEVTSHNDVAYSGVARYAQGSVHLQITTDGHGVTGVVIKDGHPFLTPLAAANVRTWKFVDHTPGTFDVTFNFHVLSNKIAFLQEPGIIDIAMVASSPRQPKPKYTLPTQWTAELGSSTGDIKFPLSFWTFDSEVQGYAGGPPSKDQEIRLTHQDGDMLGFDATLNDSVGQTLKFSLLGKRIGDQIKGVFLDYGGTSGTWTATQLTPAAQKPIGVPPKGDAPKLIILPVISEHKQPEYPLLPYEADIQGDVRLRFVADGFSLTFNEARNDYDGNTLPGTVTRISGDPLLAEAAEGNIKTWGLTTSILGAFEVTFRYRLLEPEVHFLEQPGIVEVTVPPGPTFIDNLGSIEIPRPQTWIAEFTSTKGKMRGTFSFPDGACCDGDVIDSRGRKSDILQAHLDGDMFGFDTTLQSPHGERVKVSLLGKVTDNAMKGVFLDYSGMSGTWTALLRPAHIRPRNIPDYNAWKPHFQLADTSFGKQSAILDKESNLEWLRLNFTANRSYEEVVKGLQDGGSFQGWRLATVDEVRAFFARFTGTRDGHSSDPGTARALQRLLGGPLREEAFPQDGGWLRSATWGIVGSPKPPDTPESPLIDYDAVNINEDSGPGREVVDINPDAKSSSERGYSSPLTGTFLVRKY